MTTHRLLNSAYIKIKAPADANVRFDIAGRPITKA
jgi:hypothetical protein